MRRRRSNTFLILVVLALVYIIVFVFPGNGPSHRYHSRTKNSRAQPPRGQSAVCTRVVDGDTIYLSGLGKSRLIGIDCPEKNQPGGDEATTATRNLVLGSTVRVEVCPVRPTDQYGRPRVIVMYTDDSGIERNLSIELLRHGYANVYTLPPCHIDSEEWLKYVREAREHDRGLWGSLHEVPSVHGGVTR